MNSSRKSKNKPSPKKAPVLGAYAFLDAQNIASAAARIRWKMDWYLVRRWLSARFWVSRAFLFFGYMAEQETMYRYMQECGFELIFKPVRDTKEGERKANVDAEMVLEAMKQIPHYTRAVIISGDGDFSCLVSYLKEQGKLGAVVTPNARYASHFLTESAQWFLADMAQERTKMTYKPGRPGPKPEKEEEEELHSHKHSIRSVQPAQDFSDTAELRIQK